MNRQAMADTMAKVFAECEKLCQAGQAEYAHDDTDAFANFNRAELLTGVSRVKVLMVYFQKHYDGVISYLNGHKSQREDVRGRINDMIVYMCLLRGMIDEVEVKNDPYQNAPMPNNSPLPELVSHLEESYAKSIANDPNRSMRLSNPDQHNR